MLPDKDGMRIAELDEMFYRRLLWNHKPLTSFWRVGAGYEKSWDKMEHKLKLHKIRINMYNRL